MSKHISGRIPTVWTCLALTTLAILQLLSLTAPVLAAEAGRSCTTGECTVEIPNNPVIGKTPISCASEIWSLQEQPSTPAALANSLHSTILISVRSNAFGDTEADETLWPNNMGNVSREGVQVLGLLGPILSEKTLSIFLMLALDAFMTMPDEELAILVHTLQDTVTQARDRISLQDVKAYIQVSDFESLQANGLVLAEVETMALKGMDTLENMPAHELVLLARLGTDMLRLDMLPKDVIVAPMTKAMSLTAKKLVERADADERSILSLVLRKMVSQDICLDQNVMAGMVQLGMNMVTTLSEEELTVLALTLQDSVVQARDQVSLQDIKTFVKANVQVSDFEGLRATDLALAEVETMALKGMDTLENMPAHELALLAKIGTDKLETSVLLREIVMDPTTKIARAVIERIARAVIERIANLN